jgi:hypothetical protein
MVVWDREELYRDILAYPIVCTSLIISVAQPMKGLVFLY